jgi:hypothetical protein
MMHSKKILLVILCILTIQAHSAQWQLGLGYDRGSEDVGTVRFTNTGATQTAKANEGLELSVARVFANHESSQFETAISLGYKNGGPIGTDGEITFTAWPLLAMEFYRPSNIRVGVGLAYYLFPLVTTEFTKVPRTHYKFDNALGSVVQIGWAPLGRSYSFDLRYAAIKFQSSEGFGKLNGNTFGAYASGRF